MSGRLPWFKLVLQLPAWVVHIPAGSPSSFSLYVLFVFQSLWSLLSPCSIATMKCFFQVLHLCVLHNLCVIMWSSWYAALIYVYLADLELHWLQHDSFGVYYKYCGPSCYIHNSGTIFICFAIPCCFCRILPVYGYSSIPKIVPVPVQNFLWQVGVVLFVIIPSNFTVVLEQAWPPHLIVHPVPAGKTRLVLSIFVAITWDKTCPRSNCDLQCRP